MVLAPWERTTIKRLVSSAQMAKRQESIDLGFLKVCKGCGADYDSFVPGCIECKQRRQKRIKRKKVEE